MRRRSVALASLVLAAPGAFAEPLRPSTYRSTDGEVVHRPFADPLTIQGETAVCRDGTQSVSRHRSGTCSRHGGVEVWKPSTAPAR